MAFGVTASLALIGGRCGARPSNPSPQDCAPVTGALPEGTDPAALVGEYDLQLVATRGTTQGTSVRGALRLLASPDGLIGSASIALDSVGAHRVGDIGSEDPAAPGVLAFPRADMVMLRLGSEANRKDVQPFESAYTVLHVRSISQDGFAGTWESGVERIDAAGHFCARRFPAAGS